MAEAKTPTLPPARYVPANNNLGTVTTVIVGGTMLFVTYKILQGLQLIDTAEDKREAAAAKNWNDLMKRWTYPTYGDIVLAAAKQQNPKVKSWWDLSSIKTGNEAFALAKRIWDAKGFFNDDEEKLNGVFRDMQNGMDIWLVNKAFKYDHDNRNIYDFITGFTDDEDQSELYKIVKQFKDARNPKDVK